MYEILGVVILEVVYLCYIFIRIRWITSSNKLIVICTSVVVMIISNISLAAVQIQLKKLNWFVLVCIIVNLLICMMHFLAHFVLMSNPSPNSIRSRIAKITDVFLSMIYCCVIGAWLYFTWPYWNYFWYWLIICVVSIVMIIQLAIQFFYIKDMYNYEIELTKTEIGQMVNSS